MNARKQLERRRRIAKRAARRDRPKPEVATCKHLRQGYSDPAVCLDCGKTLGEPSFGLIDFRVEGPLIGINQLITEFQAKHGPSPKLPAFAKDLLVTLEPEDPRPVCQCPCHRTPGMVHFMACCGSGRQFRSPTDF